MLCWCLPACCGMVRCDAMQRIIGVRFLHPVLAMPEVEMTWGTKTANDTWERSTCPQAKSSLPTYPPPPYRMPSSRGPSFTAHRPSPAFLPAVLLRLFSLIGLLMTNMHVHCDNCVTPPPIRPACARGCLCLLQPPCLFALIFLADALKHNIAFGQKKTAKSFLTSMDKKPFDKPPGKAYLRLDHARITQNQTGAASCVIHNLCAGARKQYASCEY